MAGVAVWSVRSPLGHKIKLFGLAFLRGTYSGWRRSGWSSACACICPAHSTPRSAAPKPQGADRPSEDPPEDELRLCDALAALKWLA
jgi:hypothetical protein